jgi:hypothetical protein
VPQVQQLRTVAFQLTSELGGGNPLGNPADDQDKFDGPPLDSVEGRVGEGVEHPFAMAASVVQDRGASASVDGHAVRLMTTWASEPVRMQPLDQLGVTGILVHQVGDREVHGRLQGGTIQRKYPEYRSVIPGCKLPSHHLAFMSRNSTIPACSTLPKKFPPASPPGAD